MVYEAISYAWGEFPKFNQVIVLDGKILKITDNLYSALMAFSRPYGVRVLWADAICINQTDTTEKSQQVALMAEIYSKANLVQVWLTLHSEAAADAMKYLKDLSSRADTFGISEDVGHPRIVKGWPNVDIPRDEADKMISDAIKHHVDFLLYRSWFNRVWVVQEVALAADLVVSCGHARLTWTELARALEVLRGVYRRMSAGEDRSRMEGLKAAWGFVKHRDEWRMLDEHLGQNHHASTNTIGEQMRNKACTDDRDRVYAMLSMTKSPYAGMVPDYTKTVAEAYTEFTRRYTPNTQIYWAGLARRLITHDQEAVDTSNIAVSSPKADKQTALNITDRDYLPSWVPEFRPARNLAWAAPFTGSYDTARAAPFFFFSLPKIEKVMFATGAVIDTIALTNCALDMKAPHYFQHPAFFFPLIDYLTMLLDHAPPPSPDSDPFPIELAKTLTSGIGDCPHAEDLFSRYTFIEKLAASRNLTPGSTPWLTTIWTAFSKHYLSPTGSLYQRILLHAITGNRTHLVVSNADGDALSPDEQLAFAFLNYIGNILISNRLSVTYEGRMGLVPGIARPGDGLALINGCHMPYVVRGVKRVTYEGGVIDEALQVVGPCYLHGVMRGELFGRVYGERVGERWDGAGWTRHPGEQADSLGGWLTFV
ncbi:heterokaryon incompatibility [Paraphaeosphaeria sporulosa]